MRKMLLVAFITLCSLAGGARAQDAAPSPEALAAAQELAAIISVDTINQMSQALTAQVWPKLQAEFMAIKVDPETIQQLRAEFENSLSRLMGDVMKDTPVIYARYFTAQELREITAFYRSPVGKKALQTMPKVTAESFAIMMPRMAGFQSQLEGAMQAVLKRRGYPKK